MLLQDLLHPLFLFYVIGLVFVIIFTTSFVINLFFECIQNQLIRGRPILLRLLKLKLLFRIECCLFITKEVSDLPFLTFRKQRHALRANFTGMNTLWLCWLFSNLLGEYLKKVCLIRLQRINLSVLWFYKIP